MKTFFLDIDGVIYKNGTINKKVLEIIKKTKNKYIFCTGRGYLRCLDIVKRYITKTDEIILENGGYIIKNNKELYYSEISPQIKKIIESINKDDLQFIIFAIKDKNEYYAYGKDNLLHVKKLYNDYNKFLTFLYKSKLCQITINFNSVESKQNFLNKCKYNKIEYKISENYVIINNYGVNKKTAIEYIIKQNHLKRDDCIIVGNDYNDIDMFNINCYKKIGILDEQTPDEIKRMATDLSNFEKLPELIDNILQ